MSGQGLQLPVDHIVLRTYEEASSEGPELGVPGPFDEFGRPGDDDLAGHVLLSPLIEVSARLKRALPRSMTFGEFRTSGLLARVEGLRDRDEMIMEAAGRHQLFGGFAWKRLVPGDICALRLEASESFHAPIVQGFIEAMELISPDARSTALMKPLLRLVDEEAFFDAMPYFLPDTIAFELLTSDPADDEMLQRIRLPYPSILCFFANSVSMGELTEVMQSGDTYALDPETFSRIPLESGSAELVGVILKGGSGGVGIEDRVWWIWSAIAGGRRATTAALGLWRESAFPGAVQNLAALVTWGDWSDPQAPPSQLKDDESTREWRRSLRKGAVRRVEPRGVLAKVHVLDLGTSITYSTNAGEPTARKVRTHWRRGTWRHQPLGPRNNPHYELRWVRPTIVNRGTCDPDPQVYRVADPPSQSS